MPTDVVTDAMVEAGARAVLARIARRRGAALQLVTNLPVPEALLEDVRAALDAALAVAMAPPAVPEHEGPQG